MFAVWLALASDVTAADPVAEKILIRHAQLRSQLLQQVDALAVTHNDPQLQSSLTAWFLPYRTSRRTIFLPRLGETTDPLERKLESGPWSKQLSDIRRQHAAGIRKLLSECTDSPQLAAELALEALREDRQSDSPREVIRARLPGYPLRDQRVVEQRIRTDERILRWEAGTYRRVTSRHYELLTNSPAGAGRKMVATLESLHALAQPLLLVTSERPTIPSRRPLRVVLFADRDQYVQHLQGSNPRIAETVGYYDPNQRTSFFYVGAGDNQPSTLLHEATHQLLHDAWNPQHAVGETSDFWAVEGIAIYLESCLFGPKYVCLGGVDADRLQVARYRGLRENPLPMRDLSRLGRVGFQQHPDLPKLYTQVAGLTHFLMDGDDGKQRHPFVQYLESLYQHDRPAADAWQAATGKSWEELDDHYRRYLRLQPGSLVRLLPRASRKLCLGLTHLTSDDLAEVSSYRDLEWLDVAHLPADDTFLERLGAMPHLRQLTLEGSHVTRSGLPLLSRWIALEELDLSGVPLGDADLSELTPLANLRVLWLSDTQISDQALGTLLAMKRLKTLGLQGTRITPEGVNRLREALPLAEIFTD